jgi:hypothetical protein
MGTMANRLGALAAVFAVSSFAAACSSGGVEQTATESAPESESSTAAATAVAACVSQEDGPCGGFTTQPCRCAAGLVCVPNRIPDIPGVCEPPTQCISHVGQPCGGFTTHPCECQPGLVCVPNRIPDLPGTCDLPPAN